MSSFIGFVIVLLAVEQIFSGTTLMYHKREDIDTINFDVVSRTDHPRYFWIVIAIQLVIAAILMAKIVQF